jgi:CobQ-like glutamine amidotransferase family enzyme
MPDARTGLRVGALYPDLLNIYADRGNLMVISRRCEWRGIEVSFDAIGLGDPLDPDRYDFLYLGGGQDADQRLCGDELSGAKGAALRDASAGGTVILAVCGGYQLLGRSYQLGDEVVPGAKVLDIETVRGDGPRLVGNVAIEVELPGMAGPRRLAGFENHGGRTSLGKGQAPLGRVISGYGNDGSSGFEGAATGNTVGTYLHGPLLPANAWFADWLIARALGLESLEGLEDGLEDEAHLSALAAAGQASG